MKKTIEDVAWAGKTALVRCDFNVPLDDTKHITDDSRIRAALPTIEYLLSKGAKVVLMSHLGRPKGEAKAEYSLAPVADRLGELLGMEVCFADSPRVVDEKVRKCIQSKGAGDLILLQNVRYRKEEEENDRNFAEDLASLADVFVQEAFGTAHRAHASTAGVAAFLPAVSGYLIEKEVKYLGQVMENPRHPFVAVLGGAKVKDKIPVIRKLIDKVDTVLIGGGMTFTFYKAMGLSVGTSIVDEESIEIADRIIKRATEKGIKLLLPVDIVCASEFSNEAAWKVYPYDKMPDGMMGLDIGPETASRYRDVLLKAATVIWNGPMGVFEFDTFARGTEKIAEAMADSKAVTIVGGGDSAAAVKKLGFEDKITHISTGGGASLKLIEGSELPGLAVIEEK